MRRSLLATVAVIACALTVSTMPGSAEASPRAATSSGAEPTPEVFQIYKSDPSDPAGAAKAYADMMAVPSTDTGYRATVGGPGDNLAAACPKSRCRDYRLSVPKGIKVTSSKVRVLFPVGYSKKKNKTKRYPVVFIWNGARSPYDQWTKKSRITALSRQYQAIFVMPEGGYKDEAGMFSDWKDGSYDWESFHTKVVVPWADRALRTKRGDRAMVGASMGAIGGAGYAARHPGMFKSVLLVSGLLDTTVCLANALPEQVGGPLGIYKPDTMRVWGNPVLNKANWDRHNPAKLAGKLKDVEVFLSSGTGFLTGDYSDPVHSGYMEWLTWETNRTFLGALTREGVPFQARIAQGNIHDYPFFNNVFEWGLPKIIAAARR